MTVAMKDFSNPNTVVTDRDVAAIIRHHASEGDDISRTAQTISRLGYPHDGLRDDVRKMLDCVATVDDTRADVTDIERQRAQRTLLDIAATIAGGINGARRSARKSSRRR